MVVEKGESRVGEAGRVGLCVRRRLAVEQRHEDALVQFRADKAQPLLQAGERDAAGRREVSAGEALGDVLQDRGVFGQHIAVVGAQGRHHPERVDLEKVRAVGQPLGAVAIDVADIRSGFVQCDARRHRAGQRREIKVHKASPSVYFCTVPHEIG